MLADLLAAAVNANVGAWKLAPMATEIEAQVIRWLAQFIGYPVECGGLLLSGGNMANLTCFLAARAAQAGWDVRRQGVAGGPGCVSTLPPRLTPGYRKPPIWQASEQKRFIGSMGRKAWTWMSCRLGTGGTETRAISHFSWSALLEPSVRARSIRYRNWRHSVRNTNSGSTSTAHTGHLQTAWRAPSGTQGAGVG